MRQNKRELANDMIKGEQKKKRKVWNAFYKITLDDKTYGALSASETYVDKFLFSQKVKV